MPFALLCDSDGQFKPDDVKLMVERISNHDVVVGCRAHRADHLMRRINGKAWTLLVRTLFGISITDMDCGFKLFRREALQGIELHANSAMITTELMAKLSGKGARICEVNVTHLPRATGQQTGNNPGTIIKAFRELFVLYGDLKAERKHHSVG
jgi:Glycosyl transferase family 2